MLKAKDFRRYARESLKGRWIKAGGVGILAGLLGASISMEAGTGNATSGIGGTSDTVENYLSSAGISATLLAVFFGVLLVLVLWMLVSVVIGGATTLGFAKYNLRLVDGRNPKVRLLFSQYDRLGTGFAMQFFRKLFVFLWSLLFVIPGIIANYSYYMTPYILCEHPEMTAREAIQKSKEMMKGNRWRLFCLKISFIGWELLASAVVVIIALLIMSPLVLVSNDPLTRHVSVGMAVLFFVILLAALVVIDLTLSPYIEASVAVFYREISEKRYSEVVVDVKAEEDPLDIYRIEQ